MSSTTRTGSAAVGGGPVTAGEAPSGTEFTGLDRNGTLVFAGLMLGMLVASLSQTIVGPAMPRIVAELGGLEHYSWIATAAMLVSAVAVPIVGKLSDIFGRRWFYLAGLAVFMVGSILAGMSTNFWFLVFARAVQGLGMGTLMPLSQTIIGDIIPPRQRGKYQGIMGAVFGVSSVAGPLIGGYVTDNFGWRYLFYLALPLGVLAFAFIWRFLHLNHTEREVKIDYLGMATLVPGLVLALLATSWGGTTYAWDSTTIITMYAVAAVLLALFVVVELRAQEPLLPLGLLGRPVIALSILASFAISVGMFGAIIYIPVYAQGVMGVSATNSGAILIPLSVAMIGMSIVSGLLVSRIGRYKEILILGGIVMVAGYWLLARVQYGDSQWHLTLAMIVIGLGLGLSMQIYTLVVQNAVAQRELGIATAAVQFFRNVGSTVGVAVLGTVMSSQMKDDIAAHMSSVDPRVLMEFSTSGGTDDLEGSVLDPSALSKLPEEIATAVRQGMGDAMHDVFLTALPFMVAALLLSLFIKQIPLRSTLQTEPARATGSIPAIGADGSGHAADAEHGGDAEHGRRARHRAELPEGSVPGEGGHEAAGHETAGHDGPAHESAGHDAGVTPRSSSAPRHRKDMDPVEPSRD